MDSDHRHELKTNELADWLGHAPRFFRENIRTIVGVVLIVVAIVTWPVLARMRQRAELAQAGQVTRLIEQVKRGKFMALQGQIQGKEMPGTLLASSSSLEIEADRLDNTHLSALALIHRAEALRADLHYNRAEVAKDTLASQIAQAMKVYNRALAKAEGNATISAMAQFGLGLCAEELGDFEQAVKIYEIIAADVHYEGTVFPRRAALRLEAMADSRGEFVFADAPEPVDSDSAAPAPDPADPNESRIPLVSEAAAGADSEETKAQMKTEGSDGGEAEPADQGVPDA